MLRRVGVSVLVIAAIAGCGRKQAENPADRPVALVAGQPISTAFFEFYVAKKTGVAAEKVDPGVKQSLLEELIGLEVAALAGSRLNKADVSHEMELARLEVLARLAADAANVARVPTEQELQSAYQAYVASMPNHEFHVAHILVATEAMADEVIKELDHGADFAKLAGSQSADDSKSRGGDLGWIYPGHLPTSFTDALKDLKPGGYTKRAIKTPYGWHVIRLLETRAVQPPSFDQVKAQLIVNLQKDRYAQFVNSLLAKTAIERMEAQSVSAK